LNSKNKDGETALHLACKLGDSELVDYLLDKGCDADLVNSNGDTCLHLLAKLDNESSKNEYLIIFEKILEYGALLDKKNNDGQLIGQVTKNNKFILKLSDYQFNMNEEVIGGDVEIGLSWKNRNDLDLHCYCRCGTHIYYGSKQCKKCRGFLDYDMNVRVCDDPKVSSDLPIEHIFWPVPKKGVFKFSVIHYKNHISVELKTEYFIAVKIKGEIVYETEGVISKEKQEQFIFMISFDENKNYEIKAIEKKD